MRYSDAEKIEPNPQAVEAIPLDAENAALAAFQAAAGGSAPYPTLMAALKAAMPHIRSQLLTELAKKFEGQAAIIVETPVPSYDEQYHTGRASSYRTAADDCRRLAAKEESDG